MSKLILFAIYFHSNYLPLHKCVTSNFHNGYEISVHFRKNVSNHCVMIFHQFQSMLQLRFLIFAIIFSFCKFRSTLELEEENINRLGYLPYFLHLEIIISNTNSFNIYVSGVLIIFLILSRMK